MGNVIVDFHGDRLLGIETEAGAFVYLKPVVEIMGMNWSGQYRRVKRDPILSEGVAIMAIPPEFGGSNAAVFLRFDLFHGWLFTVDSRRVRADRCGKLVTFQREAYQALFEAFSTPAGAACPRAPIATVTTSEGRRLVTEARHTFGTAQARELWFSLSLPRVASMSDQRGQLSLFAEEWRRQPDGARQ